MTSTSTWWSRKCVWRVFRQTHFIWYIELSTRYIDFTTQYIELSLFSPNIELISELDILSCQLDILSYHNPIYWVCFLDISHDILSWQLHVMSTEYIELPQLDILTSQLNILNWVCFLQILSWYLSSIYWVVNSIYWVITIRYTEFVFSIYHTIYWVDNSMWCQLNILSCHNSIYSVCFLDILSFQLDILSYHNPIYWVCFLVISLDILSWQLHMMSC